jgi:hypothetical protein
MLRTFSRACVTLIVAVASDVSSHLTAATAPTSLMKRTGLRVHVIEKLKAASAQD